MRIKCLKKAPVVTYCARGVSQQSEMRRGPGPQHSLTPRLNISLLVSSSHPEHDLSGTYHTSHFSLHFVCSNKIQLEYHLCLYFFSYLSVSIYIWNFYQTSLKDLRQFKTFATAYIVMFMHGNIEFHLSMANIQSSVNFRSAKLVFVSLLSLVDILLPLKKQCNT